MIIEYKLLIDTVKKLSFSAYLNLFKLFRLFKTLKFFEVVLPLKMHSFRCCR